MYQEDGDFEKRSGVRGRPRRAGAIRPEKRLPRSAERGGRPPTIVGRWRAERRGSLVEDRARSDAHPLAAAALSRKVPVPEPRGRVRRRLELHRHDEPLKVLVHSGSWKHFRVHSLRTCGLCITTLDRTDAGLWKHGRPCIKLRQYFGRSWCL